MKPTIHVLYAILTASYGVPVDGQSTGCDLPSPIHPDPIQPIELTEGMIYRYPYSSSIEVAEVGDASGSGHTISFKANQSGLFKIRIYRDIEGNSLVSEGEIILNATGSQRSDTLRFFFCGPFNGPSTNQGLVEIEVVTGSLSLGNLYMIEAYDGALHYSIFDQSLLSVSNESVGTEVTRGKARISIARSTLGHSYSIERSADLKDWKPEPNTEKASKGQSLTWELDTTAIGSQFYRIKETN